MKVIWTDPTPENTCQVCRYFVGFVFDSETALPLPAHPHCECYYTPDTSDADITEWDFDTLPDEILQHWVRFAAWYLRNGQELPPALEKLRELAEQYNQNREEITAMTNNLHTIKLSAQLNIDTADADLAQKIPLQIIQAGQTKPVYNFPEGVRVTAAVLKTATLNGKFDGVGIFYSPHILDGPMPVRDLAGVTAEATFDPATQTVNAYIFPYQTNAGNELVSLASSLRQHREQGIPLPDVGVSVNALFLLDKTGHAPVSTSMERLDSVEVVYQPAANGRILASVKGGKPMTDQTQTAVIPQPEPANTHQPAQTPPAAEAPYTLSVDQFDQLMAAVTANQEEVATLRAALEAREEETAVQMAPNPRQNPSINVTAPAERLAAAVDWFFGVKGAATPAPSDRKLDQLYAMLTGDYDFHGRFYPDRVQFAGANQTDLANLAANAMNKVIIQQFSILTHWRWYERIAYPTPNDGSVQDMAWTTLGGIQNLPTVAEKGSYTELDMDDVAETDSFIKKGGYVGITLEMIRNSDIARIQAVPRALAAAALRTRSAAIAAIFTANSGVGPTLAQDSTALFHANHNNIATTAFGTDATAWRAARAECFKHTEVESDKALGLFPKFALFPADLYDTALSVFGYGDGYPTSYAPEAQDRGNSDPRPVPLAVPDWTDATDWAYIVDPDIMPVIHISYAQAPGGGVHPAPELFSVVSPTAGLIFTNDTMPIKVRDWFAAGVNGHRGIGKRNVA